jgi:hypothetical protein
MLESTIHKRLVATYIHHQSHINEADTYTLIIAH